MKMTTSAVTTGSTSRHQSTKIIPKNLDKNKMATITTSVRSAMKMTTSAVTTGSKIISRGSFFDKESQNAFLEKHQQKCTPKNSTWNSSNSNSKSKMGK